LVVDKKIFSIFFISLIIVSIIEASIILFSSIEKPSQKSSTNSKKISIHLCFSKPVICKQIQKPVVKNSPKSKVKPKLKPNPKPKLKRKPKLKSKPKSKPVQKKVVKQPKVEDKKNQTKALKNLQPKSIQSSPKKRGNLSAQKVDRAEIDAIKAAYLKEVRELIEFNKYYPRRAKRMHRSGVVEIEFTILKSGKVSNINILKGCKYNILNRAAKRTLEKIGTFKPLPNEFKTNSLTLRVPINYILRY